MSGKMPLKGQFIQMSKKKNFFWLIVISMELESFIALLPVSETCVTEMSAAITTQCSDLKVEIHTSLCLHNKNRDALWWEKSYQRKNTVSQSLCET